jgi:hypothetical protein
MKVSNMSPCFFHSILTGGIERGNMTLHSFDPQIAAKVGVNAAVIYQNLVFWTEKNAANNRHKYDDRYWTYNSIKAFETLFPYLTTSQIRTAIRHLLENDLIVEGNYNKAGYDRTKWYSVNSQTHLSNLANGTAKNRKPIPDSKPDIKPDNITSSNDDGALDYYFEELWVWYPRKVGKGQAKKALKAALKKVSFDEIYHPLVAYVETLDDKDKQFIPHLATWLNGERWADEE